MNIDTPYYEDHDRVSNSSIGWFLKGGPSYFYKMLNGEIEGEKSTALERGTMIHSYILTPEEFQKDYVVWDKSRPSSVQQEKFCQVLAFSTEIEPNRAILDAYKKAYSTAGKSEDKMLSEGLKIASTLKDYIDFLKANDGRTMISLWDAQMLEKIRQNIESHKLAKQIIEPHGKSIGTRQLYDHIGRDEGISPIVSFHEKHINWEWTYKAPSENSLGNVKLPPKNAKVKCKSLLDGLTLDYRNKKAIIYDLKTTQKLWHFEDSIDQYDYLRQLNYYKKAVEWYLNDRGVDLINDPWEFEFYIIGIDTTGSYEIRVFKVEEYMVDSRNPVIFYALGAISWHQSTGKWDHSREYYEGDGSESLNL